MSNRSKALLITGAGGYLGAGIAARALERADRPVVLWLHARSRAELDEKSSRLAAALGPASARALFRGGDLGSAEPFADVDPGEIGAIVHAAAVTRFNVERELAEAVNVNGASRLFALAARCASLDHLVLLSSVYAAGLVDGDIAEAPLAEPPGFANHYEWSKWRAERALVDVHGDLPWSILRIATVIAADERGEVRQYNAFHNTLKLLFYGLVSLVPGNREAPLYLVTESFALDAVMAALGAAERHGVYHACYRRGESLTLGELLAAAFRRFAADEDFAARRILEPLFCDEKSFALLASGVDGFGGEVVRQGLASIVPFAAQLFSDKSFDNARLIDIMDEDAGWYRAPDARALVDATCDYLVRTRWGTRLEHAA